MTKAHINIGSNIGDRHALIELAVARIEALLGVEAKRAPIIESEPWGLKSENRFLNLGIMIECDEISAQELFDSLQEIQQSIDSSGHRNADGSYADRQIDIDLISFGTEIVNSENLTLPHPRLHLRDFVLRPMCTLEPEWIHPILLMTPVQMLAKLQ